MPSRTFAKLCTKLVDPPIAEFFPPSTTNFLPTTEGRIQVKMAPANLPSIFNATSQDIEMLLAAQCHLGSKNLQVHMESYLWKTRVDGVNVINVGKTWCVFFRDGR